MGRFLQVAFASLVSARTGDTILQSRVALDRLCIKIDDAEARGEEVWLTILEEDS